MLRMFSYPKAAVERTMKLKEVILQALAKDHRCCWRGWLKYRLVPYSVAKVMCPQTAFQVTLLPWAEDEKRYEIWAGKHS